jgi:hypothetical protein
VPLPSIRDENNLTPPFLNEFPVPQIPLHDNQFNPPVENNAVTGGENDVPGGEEDVTDNGHPGRNVGTYKDDPAKIWRLPIHGESYKLAYLVDISFDSIYPVPAISNKASRLSNYHPDEKLQKQFLTNCYFLQDKWFQEADCFSTLAHHMALDTWDDGNNRLYFNDIADPCILEAHSMNYKT